MSIYDHQDQRGVFVELWTIDLLDGDLPAALLLSQLLWWHQPGKDGRAKVTYERDGHRWLLRADDDWQEDCRMTQKQVRRVRSLLVSKGLVEHRRFKLRGAPTSAWRPVNDAIQEAIRPNPELPSEGQFHGSDLQGAVGSDPSGAVPIPSPPLEPIPTATVGAGKRRRLPLPEPFMVTGEMKAWAAEKFPSVDLRLQTAQFKDHHTMHGSTMVDWQAAWRTWIRNAGTRFAPRQTNGTARLSNVEKSWRNIQEALG